MVHVRRALIGAVVAVVATLALFGSLALFSRVDAWMDATLGLWPGTFGVLTFVAALGASMAALVGALDARD